MSNDFSTSYGLTADHVVLLQKIFATRSDQLPTEQGEAETFNALCAMFDVPQGLPKDLADRVFYVPAGKAKKLADEFEQLPEWAAKVLKKAFFDCAQHCQRKANAYMGQAEKLQRVPKDDAIAADQLLAIMDGIGAWVDAGSTFGNHTAALIGKIQGESRETKLDIETMLQPVEETEQRFVRLKNWHQPRPSGVATILQRIGFKPPG